MCGEGGYISNCYRMIITVTNMTLPKLRPSVINYRDYEPFSNVRNRNDLRKEISKSYLEFDLDVFSVYTKQP